MRTRPPATRPPATRPPATRPLTSRLASAALGPVTAGFGLAVGHLVAAATTPATSPVLVVGATVIDRTPTSLKEWAIAHLGSHDKTVLVGSVLLVVLAVSTLVGPLARRRPIAGVLLLAALALVAGGCALRRPGATYADLLPSLVAGVAAVASLLAIRALVRRARPGGTDPSRRVALLTLGTTAAGAAAVGLTGRWLAGYRGRDETFALPRPADPAGAFPAGLDRTVPGITPLRTRAADLYRVDTRLDVPVVSAADWTLTVDGQVDRPFTLSLDELLAMPLTERDITLTCVSNSVGGPYVGAGRWLGVRLTDLLHRAGVQEGADQILSSDVDGMTISTPLRLASDGRDSMVAIGFNGAPLPRAHGFPARLLVPGLYGFIGATKWLRRMTLTTYAAQDAYWTKRGWATNAPIRISSRIDTPRPLVTLDAGETVVGGVAWAQESGGVTRVEVSVDGGRWQAARLGPSVGDDYWRQWFWRWPARPGVHTLACRVVDGAGQVQTAVRATPFPSGSSGIHTIQVSVR